MTRIELAIIIPTFHERDNIRPLLEGLDHVLKDILWEVIFVDDDSKDGTADFINAISQERDNVRCLKRIGRRGLSSACIEGMLSTPAHFLAVMDADLQHDEALLPKMLKVLKTEDFDLVVGSRYVDQGSMGNLSGRRVMISRLATVIGQKILHVDLKDPMSGFFMIKRSFFEKVVRRLTGKGFKILVDLCASSSEPVRFKELAFQFRTRQAGESKLGARVMSEYGILLLEKTIGKWIPIRFVFFVFVGTLGAVVHLITLGFCLKFLSLAFLMAQTYATLIAMTLNFIFNNIFTYRDQKLRGINFWKGLFTFYIACSIGAFVNIRMATFLYNQGVVWWLSGLLGGGVGAVWNYAVTKTFTWSTKRDE